jgi:osmotically-inducible protein OsmY
MRLRFGPVLIYSKSMRRMPLFCFGRFTAARMAHNSVRGLCLAFALAALSGCASTVVGAGAIAGNAAMQDRGFVKTVEDTALETKINANLLSYSAELFVDVSVEVYEGRALLTGKVKRTNDRIEAVRVAWNVSGVREVINEIQVEDTSDLLDAARDHWVTAELATQITFDKQIKSVNYSIDTVNGTVYLMGIAQSQAELDRVRNTARQLSYVRRIVSYVRIKDSKTPKS